MRKPKGESTGTQLVRSPFFAFPLETAKAAFHETKKRTLVMDLKLYVKPEEHMAYYVINRDFTGKVPF